MTDETRRKIDKYIKISLIVAGILLICNDMYWRWYGRSRTESNNNVNRTVESIKKSNQSAAPQISTRSVTSNIERCFQIN